MSSEYLPQIRTTQIPLENRGHLARVTVDNTKRLNVLNSELILQLTEAIQTLGSDPALRCVVLTGAGERAFIGGADIREMAQLDPATAGPFISRLHMACAAIRDLPVPIIAQIQGYCLGAGLEVAACCDLRVASADATFGMPEVRVGIPSVIEAALLPSLIGLGRAKQLVLTGESISAEEAARWGLVDRVVTKRELAESTHHWASAIGAAGSHAIRLQKALLRRWEDLPPNRAVEEGILSFGRAFETDEPHRLMRAFLDRKRN